MSTAAARSAVRLPRQIPYIIGNEACERFSFYGMRNILTPFLVSTLLLDAPAAERAGLAKDVFHSFVIGVYFFPLLGGWLSDRFFGKYNTVLWFSLIYCAGHALLAAFDDNRRGLLRRPVPDRARIGRHQAAGGVVRRRPVRPVATSDLAKIVFDAFYWSINFGSFFASLLMPIFLREYGPAVAFGIPGILMGIATLIFWLGRTQYVRVPPTRGQDPHSFFHVAAHGAVRARAEGRGRPGLVLAACGAALAAVLLAVLGAEAGVLAGAVRVRDHRLPRARRAHRLRRRRDRRCSSNVPAGTHPDQAIDDVRVGAAHPHRVRAGHAVLVAVRPEGVDLGPSGQRDARAARRVVVAELAGSSEAAQMQALNPLLVMLLIPVQQPVLYPAAAAGWATSRRRCAAWAGASRFVGPRLDRRRCHSAAHRQRRADVARVADPALPAADVRRGARLGDGARVRLQPGHARR